MKYQNLKLLPESPTWNTSVSYFESNERIIWRMIKRNIYGIILMTPVLAGLIWLVGQTSSHLEWGGGYWEQWLIEHWKMDPTDAHQAVFYIRKTGHFFFYGILSLLFQLYFRLWGLNRFIPFLGVLAAVSVAALDEYLQSQTSFRSGQIDDVILDASGAIILSLIFFVIGRKRKGRKDS